MLISTKFIFVHIPRTGGTWTRETLKHSLAPELIREVRYPGHHSIRDVDEALRRVPSFWFVRNPWDWHVSRYHFWRMHWEQRTGGYSQPRAAWVEAEQWWNETFLAHDSFAAALPSMLAYRPLSYWIEQQTRGEDGDSVGTPGRFERLRSDLLDMLSSALGKDMPEALIKAVRSSAPTNSAPHALYRSYYDDRLRDQVSETERSVVERFGYEF